MSGFFSKCPSRELRVCLDFQQAGLKEDEQVGALEGWFFHPETVQEPQLSLAFSTLKKSVARAHLLGGIAGQTYFVTAQIRTDQDRVLKRTVVVRVSNNKELSK